MKKIIFIFLLAFFLFSSPFSTQNAEAWFPGADAVIAAKMQILYDTVKGFMLGAAKQAAVKALNQEISYMITGKSSQGAKFVTDWKDYLVTQPDKQTKLFMNGYIDQMTAGRGSLSKYVPAGSEGVGLKSAGGNYSNQLKTGAMSSVVNPQDPKLTYTSDPSQMFAQGNFRNLSLYLSGVNNPWAFNLAAQQKMDQTKQANQKAAAAEAQAGSGFLGTKSNGKTVTPGIMNKEAMTSAQNMPFNVVANATHIPEVITAVVSQMITKTITQGIGSIQTSINREVATVKSQVAGQQNTATSQYGPGAQYKQNWALGANGTPVPATATTPVVNGPCYGKKDGDKCTISTTLNGTCSGGYCWPSQ